MQTPLVLIVASSPFHLTLMGDLLEANDIRTVRVTVADAAIAACEQHQPTLVVLDLDLAEQEGRRLVQALCGFGSCGIPVVTVGDRSQREMFDAILGMNNGLSVGGMVEKPIDTGVFPRRVLQEIRRHTESTGRVATV
ncbi:MAG: response regulator [Planctomycetes bacterium]|nr:response regulator [Planctomycetota bacterium]